MLNHKRLVVWHGSINEEEFAKVQERTLKLHEEDQKTPVDLFIISSGGNTNAGFSFYDFMKAMKIPIRTFASGQVSSMAIVIFLLGQERFVGPHTVMLLHQSSKTLTGVSLREQQASVRQSEIETDNYTKIITSSTGLEYEYVKGLMDKETILDADEIVKFGFAHKLWLPEEDVKVTV